MELRLIQLKQISKRWRYIFIRDRGIDIFCNYKTMNYIMQAKFRTKSNTEVYISYKDIREFAGVLNQQPKDTVGFYVSNATYSTRSKNTTSNSKLNLILYN